MILMLVLEITKICLNVSYFIQIRVFLIYENIDNKITKMQ